MIRLSELASVIGAEVIGKDTEIEGVCSLTAPKEGHLIFAESEREYLEALQSPAAAILSGVLPKETPEKPVLFATDFRAAFSQCLNIMGNRRIPAWAEHPLDAPRYIDGEARVAPTARIGPFVVIEKGARVGERTLVFPFTYIGTDAEVGADSVLYPGVVVMDGVKIGQGAIIHAGAVVGSDGFGFYREKGSGIPRKIPQIGTCELGESVEIGANTCVDRATIDVTRVADHTKIDNLVQVAHNVRIGQSALIAAQVGIPGSVSIGDRVTVGGQAAFNDHIQVGHDSTIAGRAAVFSSLTPHSFVSGYPAIAHREALRILAIYLKLPDLLDRIRRLEKALGMREEKRE